MLGPISAIDLIELGDTNAGWTYVGAIECGNTGYEATYDIIRNSILIREIWRPFTTSVYYPERDFREDFTEFVAWAGTDWFDAIPVLPILTHRS
jgi:hypothetical protein